MGLDQFLYSTNRDIDWVDFDIKESDTLVYQWKNWYSLNDQMCCLYLDCEGKDLEFNSVPVRIDFDEITGMEMDVKAGIIDFSTSEYDIDETEESFKIKLKEMREMLMNGDNLYYWGWY